MSEHEESLTFSSAPAAAAAAVLGQCAEFVAELPEGAYDRPCETMMGASIGQHLRHSVDHVAAILRGIEGGVIDYDTRERGVPIESDRSAALTAIADLRSRLAGLSEADADREVAVKVMLSSDGRSEELRTTVGRELAFAAHHETHHHAMMTVIAASAGCEPPAGFGVAPSTLNHEASAASNS
jgi:uncharacterized damage-inducible protein DinB